MISKDVLRPEIAPPKTPITGAFAFDISRFTDSWAFMYTLPNQPPSAAMNTAGRRNTGVKKTTAPILMMQLRVIFTAKD
jgi:hypothetical protein